MQITITGANGFVGRVLCRNLISRGQRVTAVVRTEQASAVIPAGVDVAVVPNPFDHDWAETLGRSEAVIHLVARTHVMNETAADPLREYRHINVDLTQQILRAAIASGVRRFVFMSSIKAVSEASDSPLNEDSPCEPEDGYGISKREAEQLVLDRTAMSGVQPVIIRSPLVYGPDVRGNLKRLLQAVSRRIPLPLGGIANARSLVSVENLADALATVASHPAAAGETYHVSDGRPVSTTELIRKLAFACGEKPRLLPAPVSLMKLAGRVTGKQDEVRRLVGSLNVGSEKIRRQLDWTPPQSTEAGFEEMARSFLSRADRATDCMTEPPAAKAA